jgi:hypothetical protein
MEAEVSAKWQDLKDEAKLSFYVSAYVRAALKVTALKDAALKDAALKDREWRGAQNEYERKWKELRAGMGSGPNQSSR